MSRGVRTDSDFLGPDPNPYLELEGISDFRGLAEAKVFTLPSSGSVMLFGPEIPVVNTPEFQRLAGIKQLGMSYLVYRGATHTRFEHSLGTVHMAQKMIDSVIRNPKRTGGVAIPAQAVRLLRLAALLHDLPHVPFGHTLEDEFGVLERHDKNALRVDALLTNSTIGEILRRALGPAEFLELCHLLLPSLNPAVQEENGRRRAAGRAELSTDEQFAMLRYPFVADLVSNTVCADLLDYTSRDMHNTGLVGAIGDRFLQFLSITQDSRVALDGEPIDPPAGRRERDSGRVAVALDKKGMPRPDVESEILKLLTYRYELAERVYLHHAKNSASAMLVRAVEALRLNEVDSNFHWLTDDLLLQILAQPELAEMVSLGPGGEYRLQLKVDKRDASDAEKSDGEAQTIPWSAREIEPGALDEARRLGRSLRTRRLWKIAYLGVYEDLMDQVDEISENLTNPTRRRDLEEELSAAAGASPGQVVVHCPDSDMMEKVAKVRIRSAKGVVQTLQAWDQKHNGRIEALNRAHRSLWRIAAYTDPDLAPDQVDLVEERMRDLLRDVPSRYNRERGQNDATRWMAKVWEIKSVEYGWPAELETEVLRRVAARATSRLDLHTAVEYMRQQVRGLTDNAVDVESAPAATYGQESLLGALDPPPLFDDDA